MLVKLGFGYKPNQYSLDIYKTNLTKGTLIPLDQTLIAYFSNDQSTKPRREQE